MTEPDRETDPEPKVDPRQRFALDDPDDLVFLPPEEEDEEPPAVIDEPPTA